MGSRLCEKNFHHFFTITTENTFKNTYFLDKKCTSTLHTKKPLYTTHFQQYKHDKINYLHKFKLIQSRQRHIYLIIKHLKPCLNNYFH